MQSLQAGGKQRNAAVYGDLPQPCLQEIKTPRLCRHGQDDAAAIGQQGSFPKTDRTDGDDVGTPSVLDQAAGLWPEHRVVAIHPQQRMGIEHDHSRAFHSSAAIGSTM